MATLSNLPVKATYLSMQGEQSHTLSKDNASTWITHVLCSVAHIDPQTYAVVPEPDFRTVKIFIETFKKENPGVQVLLSIHGESSVFGIMASDSNNRKAFINSSIYAARELRIKGLDLAWKYPESKIQMDNLALLLKEWRSKVHAEQPSLLLTAAVYYSPDVDFNLPSQTKYPTYPVDVINDKLDWVNLIAYDFYTPLESEKVTRPTAALFDTENARARSGDSGLQKWKQAGLDIQKVVFGLPYGGWAWTLVDAKQNGYYAPANGPALTLDGSVNYDQIKRFKEEKGAIPGRDETIAGDYCYADLTWIAYDDTASIVKKVKYAKKSGLRGYISSHDLANFDSGLSRSASRAWDITDVNPESAI